LPAENRIGKEAILAHSKSRGLPELVRAADIPPPPGGPRDPWRLDQA
jgi:hypothetical protein